MPCVIDTHAMLGHAGLDLRIARGAGCPRRAGPGHAGPTTPAGLIRDIPNL